MKEIQQLSPKEHIIILEAKLHNLKILMLRLHAIHSGNYWTLWIRKILLAFDTLYARDNAVMLKVSPLMPVNLWGA